MQIDFSTRDGRRQQGKLIQQAAEDAGLSLEALAREIGCSRALIYQYVSGATLAQPDRIQQIAERAGKPLLYFYGGESAPDNIIDRVAGLQTLLDAQLSPPDLQEALSTCEQCIALARQAGEARSEATARLKLVAILLQQGEAARALAAIEQALPLLRQHQLTAHQRVLQQNRGHALVALGRMDDAEACFRELLGCDEWTTRWQTLVSLAAVEESRGRYFRALELLDQALGLVDSAPTARQAQELRLYAAGNMANVHLACGDAAAATTEAEKAQELAVLLANRDQYIEGLLTLGVCRRISGQLAQSRATLESALRWARLAEDAGREALAGAELAVTLIEMGRLEDGRALGKDALQHGIATNTRRAELTAQLALATGYLRAGFPQDGRYHAAQAAEIGAHLDHPYLQAQALVILGEAHRARRDNEEAHRAFHRAATQTETIGARGIHLQATLGLAQLGEACDVPALLALARALGAPALLWATLCLAGIRNEDIDDFDAAAACYRDAIQVLTALRANLAAEPTGDTYLENRAAWEPYRRLAALLRRRGESPAADDIIATAEWPPLALSQEEPV